MEVSLTPDKPLRSQPPRNRGKAQPRPHVGLAVEPLDITLAAVVQHLQVLEESSLVQTEKIGRVRTCRIEPAGLSVAEQWIRDRRSMWERRSDRLGDARCDG